MRFVLARLFDRSILEYGFQFYLTFLLFPALIIVIETQTVRRLFSWSGWGEFGKTSFNVYIWHGITLLQMNTLLYALNRTIDYNRVKYMLLFTLATELVGIVSHYCIEKPIARRVNGWLQRMEAEEAACKSDLETLGGKP